MALLRIREEQHDDQQGCDFVAVQTLIAVVDLVMAAIFAQWALSGEANVQAAQGQVASDA